MTGSSQAIQQRSATSTSGTLALLMTGAGQFLATLDLFIVNIAFPDIRTSFPGTDTQTLSWVLTAYGIVFAALLVPAGRLADVYGRRRVFRLGMLIFTLASAGCAAAPSVGVLIGFRAVQAIGAALMVPTSLGLLLASFPADRHRRVVGIWAAIGSVAASCGPPIGGFLLVAGWRWIFLVNLPVALTALVLGRRLPEQRHPGDGRLPDLFGAALLAAGIAGLIAAISNLSSWGATSGKTLTCVLVGIALLVAFGYRCARHPRPVVEPSLLRLRQLSAATVAMAAFYAAFGIMLLGGTLYLTQIWHYDSIKAGLTFAPGPIAATLFAIIGSRLPVGRRVLVITGSLLFAVAGLSWILDLGPAPNYLLDYLPGLLLSGIGVGLTQSAIIAAGSSVLPAHQYATGTGVINTARQLGSAIGVATLVSVLGAGLHVGDYRTGWWVLAAAALLAAATAPLLGAPTTAEAARPGSATASAAPTVAVTAPPGSTTDI
ncbi:MAG TPA: MFS transporter [Pseudonocardiaceae bacterium]|jgi:EmrB/QacA subfamily drug resistance transporter|nr:MFS transporter [Pseudonocardiaceae bacterium]